jgi:hypothetical protein
VILEAQDFQSVFDRLNKTYLCVCSCSPYLNAVGVPKVPHEVHEFEGEGKRLCIRMQVLTLEVILRLKWQGTPFAECQNSVILQYFDKPMWDAENKRITNKPPL